MDSELSASSDKADAAAVAGSGTSADSEASSDHETPKEPAAPSSLVADPEGVPVSCAPSDYAGSHLFGCGSGSTCSTGWGGSSWGQVLEVTLIIRANDQAGRWGDKL